MCLTNDFNIRFQDALHYSQKLDERLFTPPDLIKIGKDGMIYDAKTGEVIPELSQINFYDIAIEK